MFEKKVWLREVWNFLRVEDGGKRFHNLLKDLKSRQYEAQILFVNEMKLHKA
jgi:hypothetical protein